MNKLTFATAVLAAGLTSFAANASEGAAGQNAVAGTEKAEGVRCYLLGCYDEKGNPVDRETTGATASKAEKAAKPGKAAANQRYGTIIMKHATANGVPVNLARAIVRIESNFRANARGRAGEVGLMQIKPATARAMGYGGSIKGLYDPETNIKYGMKYLGLAQKLGGGSVCGTVLKYNAGHGAKRMNRISSAYCSKVKRQLGTS
ncbi:MAG: lytic transglycosylase domain-containing protein [Rhizobiaceae bacterium]